MIRPVGAGARSAILICLLFPIGGCNFSKAPRREITINDGWRFIRQDVDGAEAVGFNDSKWSKLTLPHTWNALDGQDGKNDYYRGAGWYRRRLTIPREYRGKSIFLRFEGASMVSSVYVNGQSAGEHRGGFGAFCFDITELVHPGANTLAVRVDNSRDPDVPPSSGDFTMFGGIYRNVHLLVLDPLSISPLDDASPGVYLKQARVDRQTAQLEILTKLRNGAASDQNALVTCKITDAAGKLVTQTSADATVSAQGQLDSVQRIEIARPHLWDGVRDPYLYQATIELRRGKTVIDRVTQPLGLRFYSVDPQDGFFLNDRHYSLHGVNVHQDYPNRGWAITPKQIDQNYKLISELGCTLVRMAHYQHPEFEYDECDRRGIIVWAELAMVNRVPQRDGFEENAKQQLRELIKQNFNHPSICFWSLYNEPSFERQRGDEPTWKLVGELNDLAHRLDGTRLTTGAVSLPNEHPANWVMDITGFNRYFGWYRGTLDDWERALDEIHRAYPARAVAMSEYGAGASVKQHEVYPATRPVTVGSWHPEEWQAITHEAAYGAMKRRPWLWGTMLWVMFDFASDGRHEGDREGINDKGLVTADRKIRKDAFYFYKANWTSAPFVYITSRRFNPRLPGVTTLKVYSNCDVVELFLDGKTLGRRAGRNGVFVWQNVELRGGRAKVRAIGEKEGKKFKDEVQWKLSVNAPTTTHVQ